MKSLYAFTTLILFAICAVSCNKKTPFTYQVDCTACKISYFDSEGILVSGDSIIGSKTIEIEAIEFRSVQIAAQSTVCPYVGTCDSSTFINDVVKVELKKGNETICTQSKSGTPLQAVTCSYQWPK